MDRNRTFRRLWPGIFLALAAGSLWGAVAGDLTGSWTLNRDASDDPRKKMEEAREQSGGSGGGGGSRMGGHHGGHRGGGGSSGDGGGSGSFEPQTGLETLRIEHQDPRIVITDGNGKEHVLYTDGRKTEEERSFGGTTKISARWKDGHVVVETEPERGPSYTETYAVTADHTQLTVTLKVKGRGRMPAMEIRRVYDSAPLPAPTPVPATDDESQVARQSSRPRASFRPGLLAADAAR